MANEIRSLLDSFWNKFCLFIKSLSVRVEPQSGVTFKCVEIGGEYKITLINKIGFIGCPYEGYPREGINIAIDCSLIINKDPTYIKESDTTVVIFPNKEFKKEDIHIFRFDFHPKIGSSDGDPLFHMHNSRRKEPKDWLPPILLKKWTESVPYIETQNMNHFRIPTPRMLFPDIIYFLVADLWRSKVHDLIEVTKDIFNKFSDFMDHSDINAETKFWELIHAGNLYKKI